MSIHDDDDVLRFLSSSLFLHVTRTSFPGTILGFFSDLNPLHHHLQQTEPSNKFIYNTGFHEHSKISADCRNHVVYNIKQKLVTKSRRRSSETINETSTKGENQPWNCIFCLTGISWQTGNGGEWKWEEYFLAHVEREDEYDNWYLIIEHHSPFIYFFVLPPQCIDHRLLLDPVQTINPFIILLLHNPECCGSWSLARILMSQHCSFEEEKRNAISTMTYYIGRKERAASSFSLFLSLLVYFYLS